MQNSKTTQKQAAKMLQTKQFMMRGLANFTEGGDRGTPR